VERRLILMAAKTTKKTGAPDFERTLAELEETVRRLEAGDLPLEESLGAFEKGVALVRTLHSRLDAVQMRIDELTQSPGSAAASGMDAALTPLDAGLSDDEDDEGAGDDDE
jgi:exodeoxyribonuclease VII small subunit